MNPPFELLIVEWRTYLAASGKARTTLRLRTNQMRRFAEQHPDPLHADAASMIDWLATPHWAPDTRKSHRAALVSFYGWAHSFGHVDVDESRKLPAISVPPGRARPAPESAVAVGILDADRRVQLMVRLAAFHGLRRGEISRVHTDDLVRDLVGWSLTVHGKGGRKRIVPLDEQLAAELLEATVDGWAFPSPRGGHLTEHHVGKLIARALPGRWTAHPLRHRFATVAYAGTRDLLAVQELLGHARSETTRGYIQLPQDALRAALAAAAVVRIPEPRQADVPPLAA